MLTDASRHGIFNRRLAEFIEDLRQAYPGMREFEVAGGMHDIVSAVTPGLPMQHFAEHSLRYRDKILARDESFLLEQDFSEITSDQGMVSMLKIVWAGMSPEHRLCVFEHLGGLFEAIEA